MKRLLFLVNNWKREHQISFAGIVLNFAIQNILKFVLKDFGAHIVSSNKMKNYQPFLKRQTNDSSKVKIRKFSWIWRGVLSE